MRPLLPALLMLALLPACTELRELEPRACADPLVTGFVGTAYARAAGLSRGALSEVRETGFEASDARYEARRACAGTASFSDGVDRPVRWISEAVYSGSLYGVQSGTYSCVAEPGGDCVPERPESALRGLKR